MLSNLNCLCCSYLIGVFLYGGSVTASQIVVMAQMNLRPARLVIAPLASSSVRTATVPILVSSVMATLTVLMVPMRMLLSVVRQLIL